VRPSLRRSRNGILTVESAAFPGADKDFLFRHVRDLPYFRGLLRAVESRFYQDLPLAPPTYDVGCGDGHFAWLTFGRRLEVGLDPWSGPIHEAHARGSHTELVRADAALSPFPDGYFGSAISNSVLEHIAHVQDVLNETARVLKHGAPFIFCVPNENFTEFLSVAKVLDQIGLAGPARAYRRLFNRISRHAHCDPPAVWDTRLRIAGFALERHWDYFSPAALATLEWGHYFGLPSLICRALLGRWILVPSRFNLAVTLGVIRKYYDEPIPQAHGAYTFYVTRRLGTPAVGSQGERV